MLPFVWKGNWLRKQVQKLQTVVRNKSYLAIRLKDQDLRDSRQEAGKTFIQNCSYDPGTNRTTINKFPSLSNYRLMVKKKKKKKAAALFLNNAWGSQKKNKMPRGLQNIGWPERWKRLRSKSKLEERVPCMFRTYTFSDNFYEKISRSLVVQSLRRVWLLVIPWTAAHQASLSFTIFWSLLKLLSIELMMPSNHLILWYPFFSCPQSFPASGSFPMSWLFISGG